ncbi:MAG: SDR family NAD(P)-dependent oxidoreductase [Solirubrobacterales bacterium]
MARRRRLPDPRKAASRLINRPTGIAGRYRPFYFLNAFDRARGLTLENAVRDKVVMITGASSGIGEAAALQLGGAGATVLLVARSADKLEALGARIAERGGIAHPHPADLSEIDDIERMAAEVLEGHGRVDVLVNNAGKSIRRSLDLSYDRFHDFERMMRLNYFGAVRLILAFLPGMRERGFGHIVNVSSAGVQTRVPRFSGYVASKSALDAFSECAQAEVAHDGVRFTTIHMPLVRTPMIAPTKIYRSFPAIKPEEAGDWISRAIVYQPHRIGTPFGNLAALMSAASPTAAEAVRNTGYRLFEDSRAARGADSDSAAAPQERPSALGSAFARLTRGVHW